MVMSDVLWRSQRYAPMRARNAGRRDAAARQIRWCQDPVSMAVLADIKRRQLLRRRMRCGRSDGYGAEGSGAMREGERGEQVPR